jgi:hypothetical protein
MKGLKTIVLTCVLMGWVIPTFASTYHVSVTGDDSANGSAATPWRTIQHAADNLIAGDTVIVHPGSYAGFILGWDYPQNGTFSHPIVFLAEPGAVIDRRNNKTPDGINLEGASYIQIEGFTIQNGDGSISRAGIRSVINTHVIIRGNKIDGMGTWAIFTGFSENVLIEENEVSRSVSQHGIYVSNSADNPIIRRNSSWGNNQCGIHMNGDLSQGGDGIISGALIEGNIIYDNGRAGGSGINCDGVQGSMFRNNLLYNNHASGISLYAIDGAAGSKGNRVVNNTIIEAADGRWGINIQDGSTGNTVLNNMIFNNHSWHGSITISVDSLPGFLSDYNIVEDRFTTDDGNSVLPLSQWQGQTGQDGNSIMTSQGSVFFNLGANDYHLSHASPAIDTGTPDVDVATDIEGTPRPQGSSWDIGAYEHPFIAENSSLRIAVVIAGNNAIEYGSWDSVGIFSGFSPIGGASNESPGMAVFSGRLYMAAKGVGTNNIYIRYQDSMGNWAPWKAITGNTTKSPALAVFNNRLYMALRGATTNGIFIRSMDDSGRWDPTWSVVSGGTTETPALTAFNGRLYLFVKGAATNNIFYRWMDSSGHWGNWSSLPGATNKPIGLTAFNSQLYLFVKGVATNDIFYRSMDTSGNWNSWATLSGQQTMEAPSVTGLENRLYAAVKGATDNNVFIRSMDVSGNWDSHWTMISADTHKSPVLIRYDP